MTLIGCPQESTDTSTLPLPTESKPQGYSPDSLPGIATRIIRAYSARDVGTLAELSPMNARKTIAALKDGSELYAQLFDASKWRMRTVSQWDGIIRAVRIDGESAKVHYSTMMDGKIAVLNLKRAQDAWYFESIRSEDHEGFKRWGTPEPEDLVEGSQSPE